MIEIADLWKSFGALPVLRGVSLHVERGSVVAIIGPSGSGKSTLLRCVNLLEDPDRGHIRVGDREMRFGPGHRNHSDRELSAFRAATGMVFQHFNLFPHMTAIGNVMAGPSIVKAMPRHEAAEIARALLAKVGLADKADSYPSQLSGGQRQRVAIARSPVKTTPRIASSASLSMDDPTLRLSGAGGIPDDRHACPDRSLFTPLISLFGRFNSLFGHLGNLAVPYLARA